MTFASRPYGIGPYASSTQGGKLSVPGPLGMPRAWARLVWHEAYVAVPSPLGQPALRVDKVWPAWLSVPGPLGQPAVKAKVVQYVVQGQVRSQEWGLLQRSIRAYERTSGELLATQESAGGFFDLVVAFHEVECYVISIDTYEHAVDFVPPIANRVVAVLADDT